MMPKMRYWGDLLSIPRSLIQNDAAAARPLMLIPALIAFMIIIFLLIPRTYLTAKDYENGEALGMWRLREDEPFSVEYTHSVQLTPVIETYHANANGDLILDETIFHSYGAGLPATTPYTFEMTKDYFRIYDIHIKIDPLVYRTGAVRAEHKLIIGEEQVPFLSFSEPRQAVLFSVDRTSLLNYFIKEVIQ